MNIEWIKLANFGEYKHSKGTQVLNEDAAKSIVTSFNSLRDRFLRRFQGIPVFIGHPDDPEFPSKCKKVYGRISNAKVEDNSLWVLVKWTEIGKELFKKNILRHLSPRWIAVPTDDGKLLPKKLLSVGMTNTPNILCEHTTKEEQIRKIETVAEEEKMEEQIPVPEVMPAAELNTVSQTMDLRTQRYDKTDGEKILELVFERMQKFSEKYGDAWMAVKRANPTLFPKNL